MPEHILKLETPTQKYVFQYSSSTQRELIDQLVELAEDPACELEWIDAAQLSCQIAQHTADECTATLTCPIDDVE